MIWINCVMKNIKPIQIWPLRNSILRDIKNAENDILNNPVYIILNLCRVCAYLKDNQILFKKQGTEWGLVHLNSDYHNLI